MIEIAKTFAKDHHLTFETSKFNDDILLIIRWQELSSKKGDNDIHLQDKSWNILTQIINKKKGRSNLDQS